jgi:hypothetical protein
MLAISPISSIEAVLVRVHHDALDQGPENGRRFVAHRGIGESLVQPLDLATVEPGEVGWEPRRHRPEDNPGIDSPGEGGEVMQRQAS